MSDSEFQARLTASLASDNSLAAAAGFEFVTAEKGRGRMRVSWRADLVDQAETGALAPGLITALLDHCCGMAIPSDSGVSMPMTATLDLRIDFLRPAAPRCGVIAEAYCYHKADGLAFVRAEAWDQDQADPIATVQATFVMTGASPGAGSRS